MAAPKCASFERRFSPKRKRPRKVDSRKKAKTPSIASGWPITPPVRRENSDQLVPNWNSIGMPVTTPRRKLMAKIFAQKRAAWLQRSSAGAQGDELHDHHQQRQAHGELREQIVERDGEGEVNAVQQEGVHTVLTVPGRGARICDLCHNWGRMDANSRKFTET